MSNPGNDNPNAQLAPADVEAIRLFREALAMGKHWYIGLLEAIGAWVSAEETYQGHRYRYIIEGEAFDWQLLAERLCATVDGLLPEGEKNALLLYNRSPLDITKEEFRHYIGYKKYHQYLNYYYGVTVERALVLAVKDEIRKERQVAGYLKEKDTTDEAFLRVYGHTEPVMVEKFRKERRYRRLKSMSLGELKEFNYWLFKYRLKHNDKERVASDTRKALLWLQNNDLNSRLLKGQPNVVNEQ